MEQDHWQYPPELLNLLGEAIWRLVRGKRELLNFFRGAGTPESLLSEHASLLAKRPDDFKKPVVTKLLLAQISELKGNQGIAVRRQLLRRVYEFDNFDVLFSNDQLPAKALVSDIRKRVNEIDAVRRAQRDSDVRSTQRMSESEDLARRKRERRFERDAFTKRLAALFSATATPQERGRELEEILNQFFALEGIGVRESFTVTDRFTGLVQEQIDGVIELDGDTYLLEAKWYQAAVGKDQIVQHLYRVFQRSQARGIFIVHPGYSAAAVAAVTESLDKAPFVLATIEEFVHLLESDVSAADWLRAKVRLVLQERRPLVPLGRM